MGETKKQYLKPIFEIDYYQDYVLEKVECNDSPFGEDIGWDEPDFDNDGW